MSHCYKKNASKGVKLNSFDVLLSLTEEEKDSVASRVKEFYTKGSKNQRVRSNRFSTRCDIASATTKARYPLMYVKTIRLSNNKTRKIQLPIFHVVYFLSLSNPSPPRKGFEFSHRCHKTKCVKLDHLSLEPHSINLHRKTCKKLRFCSQDHNIMDPDTNNKEEFPNCIFRD